MSLLTAIVPIEEFNPNKDKIALMLKSFKIKSKDGVFKKKYSEPYFVGLSISENGFSTQQLNFVTNHYPNTKIHDLREFKGEGMRVYGPDNPGGFLVFEVLLMESDADVRKVGETLDKIMDSEQVKSTLGLLTAGNPSLVIAEKVMNTISGIVVNLLKENKDDELIRVHGTLMRDVMGKDDLPFRVGQLISDSNDVAEVAFEVLGIKNSSKHKKQTRAISINH